MVDENCSQSNQVTFDINIPVPQDVVDILELFVSNRNQTGPDGDLIASNFDKTSQKKLTVVYKSPEARETVLRKRFFLFDRYFLRASQNGYMNEELKPDKYQLVLRNSINAEFLLPENQVISIDRSKFFKDTCYIWYKYPIDEQMVLQNYGEKQAQLKEKNVTYLHAFKTSTVLIGKRKNTNVAELMDKLTNDIVSRLGPRPNLFLDQGSSFVLCQFKSELETDAFLGAIESYLRENQLVFEYLHNFELTSGRMKSGGRMVRCFGKATQTVESFKGPVKEEAPRINGQVVRVESKASSEIREVSAKGNYEVVYEHFNDSLKGVSKKETMPKLSLQIIAPVNAILSECLFKCSKILFDFRRDLETILPSCKLCMLSDLSSFLVAFKQNDYDSPISQSLVTNLMASYEKDRLKNEIFEVDNIFKNSKANVHILLQSFNQKKEIEAFKSKLNIYFNSTKCVHVQYNKLSHCFEIKGYAQAVHCSLDCVKTLHAKAIRQIEQKSVEKKSFSLSASNDTRVSMLFKFDDYYFKDFQRKLAEHNASATVKKGTWSVVIAQSQLDGVLAKEVANSWRSRVDKFISEYLSLFDTAVFDLPFDRDSPEAFKFLYDKYALDALWLSEKQIKLFGVKEKIEEFHHRIYACQINEVM